MQESSDLKQHFVGRDGYIWWVGQIASEKSWKENIPGKPEDSNSSIKGFSERYRVRIIGQHPQDLEGMEEDDLPWAYVEYPVTAGGGGRSSFQSANITQGTFVRGYYWDGQDGQVPVIASCIGFNQWQAIAKKIPEDKRFVAFSGYLEDESEKIASYTVKSSPGGLTSFPEAWRYATTNQYFVEDTLGSNALKNMAGWEERLQGKKKEPIAKTEECEPMPSSAFAENIKNSIQRIQELERSLYDYRYALTGATSDIVGLISLEKSEMCVLLAALMKDMILQVESSTLRELNNKMKKLYYLLHPNEQQEFKKKVETVNDGVSCLFKNIINALFDVICQFVNDSPNNVVNVTDCFIDNALGQILGQAVGEAQAGINLGGINAGFEQGVEVGSIVINALANVNSFLNCEQKDECSQLNTWSIWDGAAGQGLGSASNILNVATSVAQGGNFGDLNFGWDPEVIYNQDGCNTGPRPCGPPQARWISATGSGAQGNLIISSGGAIIGYDPIEVGSGYVAGETYGYAYDDCGNGDNGVFYPIVEDGGITDIVVTQPGTDYLPGPNGCTGGDGREWSCENDTDITYPDGSFPVPIPPGNVIEVKPGDIVNTPCCSEVVTEPIDNDPTTGGETISGCSNHVVQRPGRFTTPPTGCPGRTQGNYPSSADGSYPVILYLCEIIIQDAGIAYQPGDEVVIEPPLGSAAVLEVDQQGRISAVKVTEGGEGFQEMPKIYVRSDTGFNAELLPKFCVYRVGEDEFQNPELQDKIVTVIDCVGKF